MWINKRKTVEEAMSTVSNYAKYVQVKTWDGEIIETLEPGDKPIKSAGMLTGIMYEDTTTGYCSITVD